MKQLRDIILELNIHNHSPGNIDSKNEDSRTGVDGDGIPGVRLGVRRIGLKTVLLLHALRVWVR